MPPIVDGVLERDQAARPTPFVDGLHLIEVRANAFAANFLMPKEGVRRFVAGLGRGKPSPLFAEVFDEAGYLDVEGCSEPGTSRCAASSSIASWARTRSVPP